MSNARYLNHVLTLLPKHKEDEVGITINEFRSKLNEEFIGDYDNEKVGGLLRDLFNDFKIEKIIEDSQPFRFRQVRNIIFY